MLDESSLQFSRQLVANLERPDLQDVAGVVESGESREKHHSNFARPRLALEMDRFAPDRYRRVPVVLCEKIPPAVRHRKNQTDRCALSGVGSARSFGLVTARHFIEISAAFCERSDFHLRSARALACTFRRLAEKTVE